ncbi:hypothetical protein PSI23_04690 [Xenorhabdus sp. XENO-10]|uniref:Uncharacterized protein n=1 Tax=Xenorhabdus yunnanensis TaxID=3025878 RepID=A0ABT5LC24_9GAMM|nr:hypothetical protein [Xenorhabdus yunnanensis]MDC9588626.1 hypothetical protein [Xenorhabdus yunnanensis]
MKKLFKLKEWFTLEETARRLTSSFEEEISVADCLSLALDKRLTISALLDKSSYAVKSKVKTTTMRDQFSYCIKSTTSNGAFLKMLTGERFYTNEQLDCEYEKIERIGGAFRLDSGIYDLPMIGAEELDVMHQFDLAQNRKPREYANIEGAFLNTKFGMVNILASFNQLTIKYNGKEMGVFDAVKNEFVDYNDYFSFFYPDDGLGDVEFVFRRENIEKFEQSALNDGEAELTLDDGLLVIGSMLSALKKAKPESKRWTQDALKGELEKTCPIGARTLDKYFAEANKRLKSIN